MFLFESLKLSTPLSCLNLSFPTIPSHLPGNLRYIGQLFNPFSCMHWIVLSFLPPLNAVHFKSFRRIFRIKSSYYHRVLSPSDADCSNEYLSGLAFSSRRVLSPSQTYSHDRLWLLGHILRHTDSIEYNATFMPSGAYRFIQGPNRVGRPRLHWSESCMTEASNRIDFLASDSAPHHSDIHNDYFRIPSSQEVLSVHSTQSVVWMDNTLLYRKVRANAQNRNTWNTILHKPTKNYSI